MPVIAIGLGFTCIALGILGPLGAGLFAIPAPAATAATAATTAAALFSRTLGFRFTRLRLDLTFFTFRDGLGGSVSALVIAVGDILRRIGITRAIVLGVSRVMATVIAFATFAATSATTAAAA